MNKLKWLVRNAENIFMGSLSILIFIGGPALWIYYEGLWIAFLGISGIILTCFGGIMISVYLDELFNRLEEWAKDD